MSPRSHSRDRGAFFTPGEALARRRYPEPVGTKPVDRETDRIYQLSSEQRFPAVSDAFTATSGYSQNELRGEYPSIEALINDPVTAGFGRDISERSQRHQQLEASNERLEQFAYAACHDLQEPLRMVSSYLRLIEERYGDELDDEGEEFLEFAVDGADRMREMIDGLLAYSRIEPEGDSFESVDLNDIVADVKQALQLLCEEHQAEITVAPLPTVTGDRGQLGQLFQNLVENAVTNGGDAPPRIRISAERDDSAERHVYTERDAERWLVSVRDEGIGIDPADADRIFEAFQSLDGPDENGSGIGLALCKRIVERHGGDIWVDSSVGEGATFSFTLSADGDDRE